MNTSTRESRDYSFVSLNYYIPRKLSRKFLGKECELIHHRFCNLIEINKKKMNIIV